MVCVEGCWRKGGEKTVSFIEKEIDRVGMRKFVSQILVPTEKFIRLEMEKKSVKKIFFQDMF